MTERQARENGIPVSIGRFPSCVLGKAHTVGAVDGFFKVLREQNTGQIVGVHIAGYAATEMIHSVVSWIGKTPSDMHFDQLVYPPPTFSDGLKEALEDTFASALHLPPLKNEKLIASIL
jgi:dihydrolipoamide dehydrogenase